MPEKDLDFAMSNASLSFQEHAFALYARPGINEACLRLQDRDGLDVVMVLFLCWLGRNGVGLDQRAVGKAVQAVTGWREEVVLPLRQARRAMKTDVGAVQAGASAALREKVKEAELEAEVLQIAALQRLAEHLPGQDGRTADRAGLIRGSLSRYLGFLDVRRSPETTADLEELTAAALAV